MTTKSMRGILFLVSLSGIGLSGCGAPVPPPSAPATPFKTVADMKQLMNWVIDPAAQVVWKSVGTIVDEQTHEFAPSTDEEWARVHNAAATLAESGNLLMMEGRARNRADWMMKSRRLIDMANDARKAAAAKDAEALFVAGGLVYEACSDCHAHYMTGQANSKP
jgi:hypothetical protein